MLAALEKAKPLYDGRHVTREQYLDLANDGFKYEMIDGILKMSPSSFFDHNLAASNFEFQVKLYLQKNNIAHVTHETDVLLADGGDILRPDISLVLIENKDIIIGHIHGTPDLVCEVLSDSTRERDLGIKADRYLKNGVKEYWILDPNTSIQASRSGSIQVTDFL